MMFCFSHSRPFTKIVCTPLDQLTRWLTAFVDFELSPRSSKSILSSSLPHPLPIHFANTLALIIRPVILAYFGAKKNRKTNYSPRCLESVGIMVHFEAEISST